MNKLTYLIAGLFLGLYAIGQPVGKLKMIVDMQGKDTLKIQHFDEDQRLIFWKSFPQYGISQILTYSYVDNKLSNYTWAHSTVGYVISEYTYDSVTNTRTTFSFEPEDGKENGIPNLMTFHSREELKASNQYQKLFKPEKKFLKEITFYRDTLQVRDIRFNRNGDTTEIVLYSYTDRNLLQDQKLILKHNDAFNDVLYVYDANGNELGWTKVFNGRDTSYQVQNKYQNGFLSESKSIGRDGLESVTKYEYSKGLLVSKKKFDAEGKLDQEASYSYNKDRSVQKIQDWDRTVYYFYQ